MGIAGNLISYKSSWSDFFLSTRWKGKPYLLSSFFDFLMAGGGALITLAAITFFIPNGNLRMQANVIVLSSGLSYIVNSPHFMMSYQLFYDGYRQKLESFRS